MGPGARLFILIQYLVPQHGLTALVYGLTRIRRPAVRRALIASFRRLFPTVNLAEAAESDPEAYGSFNEFFTRALAPGARPIATAPTALAAPCDGAVSQRGTIDGTRLLQARLAAKASTYTLGELVGDETRATPFVGGEFATVYLAPFDYHRVHMPFSGTLTAIHYIPGALFSVNATTAAAVPRLFARNERVVCLFDTELGPLGVVFVGALNVGSVSIVGFGDLTPIRPREPRSVALPATPLRYAKGDELGRFNMGSTIILLLPRGTVSWAPAFVPGAVVRMGAEIGTCGYSESR